MMRGSSVVRARVTVVVTAAVALAACVSAGSASADGPGYGNPAVASLGDSYISGEAGRWAGNTNQASSRVDALGVTAYREYTPYLYPIYYEYEFIPRCHRSRVAEVHTGEVFSVNLACSGATTLTRWGDGFKPGIDFYNSGSSRGQALMLQEYARAHNVKLVALSIGGNDFEFGRVVSECVGAFFLSAFGRLGYCKDSSSLRERFASGNVVRQGMAIAGAIRNVREAMVNAGYRSSMYKILVQDYPSAIPGGSGFRYNESLSRQTTGGCGLWNVDANWANEVVLPTINQTIYEAINYASGLYGVTNVERMHLASAFDGRRLCENTVGLLEERGLATWSSSGAVDRTEWVSQIRTVSAGGLIMSSSTYQVQEDLHPNYWGQLALRNCLRQAYNNGAPRGGTCVRSGSGVTSRGEPVMTLQ
jgi:hypothetical protein